MHCIRYHLLHAMCARAVPQASSYPALAGILPSSFSSISLSAPTCPTAVSPWLQVTYSILFTLGFVAGRFHVGCPWGGQGEGPKMLVSLHHFEGGTQNCPHVHHLRQPVPIPNPAVWALKQMQLTLDPSQVLTHRPSFLPHASHHCPLHPLHPLPLHAFPHLLCSGLTCCHYTWKQPCSIHTSQGCVVCCIFGCVMCCIFELAVSVPTSARAF